MLLHLLRISVRNSMQPAIKLPFEKAILKHLVIIYEFVTGPNLQAMIVSEQKMTLFLAS